MAGVQRRVPAAELLDSAVRVSRARGPLLRLHPCHGQPLPQTVSRLRHQAGQQATGLEHPKKPIYRICSIDRLCYISKASLCCPVCPWRVLSAVTSAESNHQWCIVPVSGTGASSSRIWVQFISCLESPAMRVNNVVVRVVTHTHLKQIIGPLSIISTVHRCSPWLIDI